MLEEEYKTVKIIKNTIVVLDKISSLKAVWIHPLFV